MGIFKPESPTPPNPIETARASTSTNVSTAVANAFLNNVNQKTPQGSLNYDPTGNYNWTDPTTGTAYNIPTFTATQSLSPSGQAIQTENEKSQYNLANMAANQSSALRNLLGNYFNPTQGSPGSPGSWDANAYLQANPDVAAIAAKASQWGETPATFALRHYNEFGRNEGRSGLFGATGPTGPAPAMGDINSLNAIPYAQGGFADVGGQQRSLGNTDFTADRARVEEALYQRMDPQLQRDRQAMEARLADQGIQVGSMAHQQAMDQFNRQLTDTRLGITQAGAAEQAQAFQQRLQSGTFANQAQQQDFQQQALRGQFGNQAIAQNMARNQSIFNAQNEQRNRYLAEQYQQRNQPINEITSLLSGSQVSGPNFVSTPSNQIATTDIAGLINNRFSQDMDSYKQQSANFNSLMGGIFGALGGLAKSDRREKENIDKVGSIFAAGPDGEKPLPIYEYSFKDDPASTRHVGPMAQDVEQVDRRAVVKDKKGVKYIDKTRLGSILKVA